jgi:hypothetical protein
LHQYQREIKRISHNGQALEYIEVTLADIETANRLAHEVLGRTLEELPPQTCTLLKQIKTMVTSACKQQGIAQEHYRFSRRDVREYSQWGNTQLRVHLDRLVDFEYVLAHRGRQGQGYVYELLYDGDLDQRKHLTGLIDVENLRKADTTTPTSRGKDADFTGRFRPDSGPKTGAVRGEENAVKPSADKGLSETKQESGEKGHIGPKSNATSYDGQEAQVPRAQGCAGAARSHSPAFTSPAHPAPEALAHPCASVAKGV